MHHVKARHHFKGGGGMWKVQRSGEPMRGIYWPSDELKLNSALRANYLFVPTVTSSAKHGWIRFQNTH